GTNLDELSALWAFKTFCKRQIPGPADRAYKTGWPVGPEDSHHLTDALVDQGCGRDYPRRRLGEKSSSPVKFC
ncbi:MAG: hypothetical protein ACKVT0_02500, partial [Planctomycetaceae bacterium]